MTSSFSVRPAHQGDVAALGLIAETSQLFPRDLLPAMIAGHLDGTKEDIWLVATVDASVVGFAFCESERMTSGTWNLLAIAVLPDQRGRKIGRTLVSTLENWLRAAGQRILLVETLGTPDFAATRTFYLSIGFVEEARIRDFYEPGGDKVVFWKRLS